MAGSAGIQSCRGSFKKITSWKQLSTSPRAVGMPPASMSKMMGREISEDQMKQMQGMMDKMSPEDLQKWSNRAATAANWMKKPVQLYQKCKAYVSLQGVLAIVAGLLAVMAVGHFSDSF